ncbi:UPF0223 family protein [Fructilactobacillus fructivorans]|uniref:UPF0223 family protein n=1 Tax=Fructilactobacillus fructivorans TaxID=1614 RepID=UPI000704F61E|nr:UPF0223 family protein [Fructilactobacillus fructivorans]KRN39589.1 hypothetical protein IV51_GL000956 [Fructilactobacillus fructivorans]
MPQKTNESYSYPIVDDWSRKELIDVCHFFENIEMAYNKSGVSRKNLMDSYHRFCEINPAKVEQNNLQRDFEKQSELDVYHVMKLARDNPGIKTIKRKG